MRKKNISESQIAAALRQVEAGQAIKDVCAEIGVSEATFYTWRSRYGSLSAEDAQRLREIEIEHAKLKRMYAELAMENKVLREIIARKGLD